MKWLLMLSSLFVFNASAQAVQQCLCVVGGCKVASTYYANDWSAPTGCVVYKSGAVLVTGTIVQSSSIPLMNNTVCTPADAQYNPGPAGSLACFANIPAQPQGATVSLTVRGINGAGEALDGGVLTFQSVSQLPTVPPGKALRVTP